MSNPTEPKINKLPFFVGDILLLGTAYFFCTHSKLPMGPAEIFALVLCVAGGALLSIVPFVLEYKAMTRLAEAGALTSVTAQIKNVETIATQISAATGRWQNVHEEAGKTAAAAKAISERMGTEVQTFTQFMQRANDTEKATLRLEIEKLRRTETDWLQVVVRMLDHVYALHLGALRSGQPGLIEQVTNFQNACREAARRVGLVPFAPNPSEQFDAQRHQVLEGEGEPAPGATIAEIIAAGYTLQGRLIRPALVRLRGNKVGTPAPSAPATPAPAADAAPKEAEEKQSKLPLGAAATADSKSTPEKAAAPTP